MSDARSLDLDVISREWLSPCGPHDYGVDVTGCACPDGDYRPVMLRLVREVERLRKVVDRAERNNCGCLGYPIDHDNAGEAS